jgi:N-acetylneuraminic acid mutarotase
MKSLITRAAALALLFPASLIAQVPQIINYQGRVAVGTTNFDGSGQFKFALVNSDGSNTFWSNDGTSNFGSQPTNAVTLTVTKGLYSVLLGDTTLANMTAIPNSVFANSDVRLRVWFNDGTNGSQLLTPDQRLAAVGYAMTAGSVPDNSITSAQLASGAAAANLAAGGQSAVPSGGMLLSSNFNDSNLLTAGYVKIGRVDSSDTWEQRGASSSPSARAYHKAVWTGSEMIVWGGANGIGNLINFNDGGSYNPTANSWTAVTTTGAPAARREHTAVWTGSEMIVWGGRSGGTGVSNDGGRYNPTANSWTAVTTTGAPAERRDHTAVWTGSEMIVWGGGNGFSNFNDGGRYNPTANSWTAVTTTGAPAARNVHRAVWTGSEMIVWGGFGSGNFNDGGRYNPTANSWTAVTTTGAPAGRRNHTAVWTGSEMIVWGGWNGSSNFNDGGRYNPTANSWSAVTTFVAPAARAYHTAVWTGSEMIIWGGVGAGGARNDGGRYNPTANGWTAMTTTGAPAARTDHTAVWTGSEVIVWGGWNGTSYFNDTFSNYPARTLYLYQRP